MLTHQRLLFDGSPKFFRIFLVILTSLKYSFVNCIFIFQQPTFFFSLAVSPPQNVEITDVQSPRFGSSSISLRWQRDPTYNYKVTATPEGETVSYFEFPNTWKKNHIIN